MKILVVDDSVAMRLMIIKTLRQAGFGGNDVVQAADGVLGLQAANDENPDLILCDWNMPNMNGIEMLKALREAGNDVTFGFITTEAGPPMRKLAKDNGAKFLISKPFSVKMFEEVLGAVIG